MNSLISHPQKEKTRAVRGWQRAPGALVRLFNVGHKLPDQIPRHARDWQDVFRPQRYPKLESDVKGTLVAASTCVNVSRPRADPKEPLVAHADLAGLAVHDSNNLRVGHVYGVLTQAETGLVRFLDVEIDGSARHVLIPVGHARLEEVLGQKRIRLRAATVEDLEAIPAYAGEHPTVDLARTVAGAFGRLFRGGRYYAHPAYDHRGLYAGEHAIVSAGEARPGPAQLERLSDSEDYKIAAGEPDIRGWNMLAMEEPAGVVHDLIIDPEAEQVRYVVVELKNGAHALLPIGYLELDRTEKIVLAPGLSAADIEVLPPFEELPLTRAQEIMILNEIERALDARNPFLRVDFSGREMIA
jgi:hypothetical protein